MQVSYRKQIARVSRMVWAIVVGSQTCWPSEVLPRSPTSGGGGPCKITSLAVWSHLSLRFSSPKFGSAGALHLGMGSVMADPMETHICLTCVIMPTLIADGTSLGIKIRISRSLKVIESVTYRPIEYFLLVIHNRPNHGSISYCFRDKRRQQTSRSWKQYSFSCHDLRWLLKLLRSQMSIGRRPNIPCLVQQQTT